MIAFTRVKTNQLIMTFIIVKIEKRKIERYEDLSHCLYLCGKSLP